MKKSKRVRRLLGFAVFMGVVVAGCSTITGPRVPPEDKEDPKDPPPEENAMVHDAPQPPRSFLIA